MGRPEVSPNGFGTGMKNRMSKIHAAVKLPLLIIGTLGDSACPSRQELLKR